MGEVWTAIYQEILTEMELDLPIKLILREGYADYL